MFRCTLTALAIASSLLAATTGAHAQSSGTGTNRASYIPYTSNGYLGFNLGRSNYNVPSGLGGFAYDDTDVASKIYAGGSFNRNLGLELAYIHMGTMDRAGGSTRAQGVDLSLVGRVPLGDRFDVFGKVGTTYGWTRASAVPASGLGGGKDHGFGVSYGVGASYYFTPQWAAVLEWESHDFRFAGTGRDAVHATTVGVRYNY
jgi:OmpA-OmpF porin, OOP family